MEIDTVLWIFLGACLGTVIAMLIAG